MKLSPRLSLGVWWSAMLILLGSAAIAPRRALGGVPPPLPGEDCATCEAILDGTVTGSTTGYGGTDLTQGCTTNDFRDRWYCYTAPRTCLAYASLCGSAFDTSLAVYATCPAVASVALQCNDDATGICSPQSQVEWMATQGTTYYIRIAGYQGGSGAYTLTVSSLPILAGPILNPANGHVYYLLRPMKWTSSENSAHCLNAHLATVNDAAENEWIRVNVANYGGTARRVWIGLSDAAVEGTFVWAGEASAYTNWAPGRPNTSLNNTDDYVELSPTTGKWNDGLDQPTTGPWYGVVEATPVAGDMNCDSMVTTADIEPLATALVDPVAYASEFPTCDINRADVNADGAIDGRDVAAFVHLLAP